MGPFPHDAPPPAISEDNPMGTDGFEFVEYCHPNPEELDRLFKQMGLSVVARHRSKNVVLYLPAFEGPGQLGLNVATIFNLQVFNTLRKSPWPNPKQLDFGKGTVFSTRLVNALITEDGKVYVGTVTKDALVKAAEAGK